MKRRDIGAFALKALAGSRMRAGLTVLAIAVGVAGVVVLTWLGDAARLFVGEQFRSIGTNLVIVLPGRSETIGGPPPIFGETPRDLTLADAFAVGRSPFVRRVTPVVVGNAMVASGRLDREAMVLGATPELFPIRHLRFAIGASWTGEWDRAQPVCVLGPTLRDELLGNTPALGAWLRIGEHRFRVVGVLASEGRAINMDVDDMVVIPVASALALFDQPGLFRILVEARDRDSVAASERDTTAILRERHDGEEDVTIVTQDAVLSTFDGVLRVLTLALGGIASIALVVAGILIMNVMVVAVTQRQEEIGLLKALGASPRTIRRMFVVEAALLAAIGAFAGLVLGQLLTLVGNRLYPELEPGAPWWSAAAAVAAALLFGLGFGQAPARRASRLDPVHALSRR